MLSTTYPHGYAILCTEPAVLVLLRMPGWLPARLITGSKHVAAALQPRTVIDPPCLGAPNHAGGSRRGSQTLFEPFARRSRLHLGHGHGEVRSKPRSWRSRERRREGWQRGRACGRQVPWREQAEAEPTTIARRRPTASIVRVCESEEVRREVGVKRSENDEVCVAY